MNKKEQDFIDKLKESANIPPVVWNKTEEAFSQIEAIHIKKEKNVRWTAKKWIAAAAIAVMALSTVTVGAAALARWNKHVAEKLQATKEQQQELSTKGMVTEGKEKVTANKITIEHIQTIADNRYVTFWFQVTNANKEIKLSENMFFQNIEIKISGMKDPIGLSSSGFIKLDDNKYLISYHSSLDNEKIKALQKKTVTADLENIVTHDSQLNEKVVCKGSWSFKWNLFLNENMYKTELNKQVVGFDVAIKEIELSPVSYKITYTVQSKDTPVPVLVAFRMKDGSLIQSFKDGSGSTGYTEDVTQWQETESFNRVINVKDIASLLFLKSDYDTAEEDPEVNDMVEIPIF